MFSVRTFSLMGLFILVPQAQPGSVPRSAEYIGGTVQSIPAKSLGTLDLKNVKELQFKFGSNTYKMPYQRIESYKLSDAEGHHRKIAHVPVPRVLGGAQILDVTFKNPNGTTGMMSFRLSNRTAASASHLLAQRVHPQEDLQAGTATENWWGDSYWKTKRNSEKWADSNSAPLSAGGSK